MSKGQANRSSSAKRVTKASRVSDESGDEISQSQLLNASVRGIDHYAIAVRAREIWEREGYPEGKQLEHWLQAERELMQAEINSVDE